MATYPQQLERRLADVRDVLSGNRDMQRFVKALGFQATPDPLEPTMARVEMRL